MTISITESYLYWLSTNRLGERVERDRTFIPAQVGLADIVPTLDPNPSSQKSEPCEAHQPYP